MQTITMQGHITIKTRTGRNGVFNVGVLTTDIGTFNVNDKMLMQYDEGIYTGQFVVSRIYLNPYSWNHVHSTELRAVLDDMVLDDLEDLSEEDKAPITYPDPVDETKPIEVEKPVETSTVEDSLETETIDEETAGKEQDNPDAELFGFLYPLGKVVKLDKTVDRTLFRNC